jgi:hypothetical protein
MQLQNSTTCRRNRCNHRAKRMQQDLTWLGLGNAKYSWSGQILVWGNCPIFDYIGMFIHHIQFSFQTRRIHGDISVSNLLTRIKATCIYRTGDVISPQQYISSTTPQDNSSAACHQATLSSAKSLLRLRLQSNLLHRPSLYYFLLHQVT